MKKEIRRFEVNYNLDWAYGVEISKMRADLDALEKLGATSVDIQPGVDHDSPYVEIIGYTNRLETDEELAARISKIEKEKEALKQRELKQLEILKAKYGN